jgi:hypothetical protein
MFCVVLSKIYFVQQVAAPLRRTKCAEGEPQRSMETYKLSRPICPR